MDGWGGWIDRWINAPKMDLQKKRSMARSINLNADSMRFCTPRLKVVCRHHDNRDMLFWELTLVVATPPHGVGCATTSLGSQPHRVGMGCHPNATRLRQRVRRSKPMCQKFEHFKDNVSANQRQSERAIMSTST